VLAGAVANQRLLGVHAVLVEAAGLDDEGHGELVQGVVGGGEGGEISQKKRHPS
jgi:hypothetical protein